jgi:hypothetical protein
LQPVKFAATTETLGLAIRLASWGAGAGTAKKGFKALGKLLGKALGETLGVNGTWLDSVVACVGTELGVLIGNGAAGVILGMTVGIVGCFEVVGFALGKLPDVGVVGRVVGGFRGSPLLGLGASDGLLLDWVVGAPVGLVLGVRVKVGDKLGRLVGKTLGRLDGEDDGILDGKEEGLLVGDGVGLDVGGITGDLLLLGVALGSRVGIRLGVALGKRLMLGSAVGKSLYSKIDTSPRFHATDGSSEFVWVLPGSPTAVRYNRVSVIATEWPVKFAGVELPEGKFDNNVHVVPCSSYATTRPVVGR